MTTQQQQQESAAPTVVTLFDLYGAGAGHVGPKVAEALGLPFHGQAFSSEDLEGGEDVRTDQRAVLSQVYLAMGGAYGGFEGRDVVATQQEKYDLVMDNNRTVRQYADEGGVIVGRNATVILADRPNTVHVLLTGSVQDRVAHAAQEFGISADRAADRQRREDQVRADMSIALYGWDPREPGRYDLVINTSRIDPDAAVDAIIGAARARSARPPSA